MIFNSSPIAPIEALPAEILQEIFLLTDMDVHLPRASLTLSCKLSDPYVLSLFCEKAFRTTSLSPNQAMNYRERQKRVLLQRQLFGMRWMTWSFFSPFLQRWKNQISARKSSRSCLSQTHRQIAGGFHSARGRLSEPCPFIPEVICSLPDKLLRGPFTKDKLNFLRCLLSISNASVDWANKESVRLSILAKREAILERNLEAVHLLSGTRRLAKAPNLELVKFAVIEGGCDRSIVLELMTAAREWGHRRWADVELDAWVAREAAQGSLKARWLRIKLDELRYGKFPDPKTGDYVGDYLVVKPRVGKGLAVRFYTEGTIRAI
jgi:hypothetical protein